ncbi:MAG: hypothetical protein AB8B73_12705, partial [Ekhidna sp.]
MKKFLIVIAILLLCGVGYFTYDKWVKDSDLTAWSFVPNGAAVVLETEVLNDFKTLEEYPLWKVISDVEGLNGINEGVSFLDSINGDGGFSAIFKSAPALISLHKISSSNFDFLFVLDIQNLSQNTFISASIGQLKKKGYRFKTRNYNGFKISEIGNKDKAFTFIFYKNYFLASFTPYLVEDAIRTISDSETLAFKETMNQFEINSTDDNPSIYVNYEQVTNLMKAFSVSSAAFPLDAGKYEISLDSNYFGASGFSFGKDDWLSTHDEQPSSFEMAEIIPSNTAILHHITSTNFTNWKEKQMAYIQQNDERAFRHQDSLKQAFDFNAGQVLDLVEGEIGLATLESSRASETKKLFILEVNDINESLTFFDQVTERIAYSRGDSVYSESYSDSEIRFLPIQDFPMTVWGAGAEGFTQCFYMSYRNYLIFSNNLNELKSLISSIQNENTWGKSLNVNRFLARTNNAANVNLFINIPRAWSIILPDIKNEWSEYFKTNTNIFKSFEFAAFQFSYIDDSYFTNFTFTQPTKQSANIPKTSADNGVRFASNIISKPHLIKTHSYLQFDMLLQDSTNTVYYLDRDQNALWTKTIDEPIISDIFPVDFYKNGKLQYAFATAGKIHIIDKTG